MGIGLMVAGLAGWGWIMLRVLLEGNPRVGYIEGVALLVCLGVFISGQMIERRSANEAADA